LRAALGADRHIRFLSASRVYGRTAQAILTYRQLLEQAAGAGVN
jgi:hypothetical protein